MVGMARDQRRHGEVDGWHGAWHGKDMVMVSRHWCKTCLVGVRGDQGTWLGHAGPNSTATNSEMACFDLNLGLPTRCLN